MTAPSDAVARFTSGTWRQSRTFSEADRLDCLHLVANCDAFTCPCRPDNHRAVIGSTAFYAGVVVALAGLLGVVHPIALLGLTSRMRGATLLAGGVALAAIAVALPARRSASARLARLDEFAPVFEFHEVHSARVAAQPAVCIGRFAPVTAGEIPLFQLLTRIRRLGRLGPESILNAPQSRAGSRRGGAHGFVVLADDAHASSSSAQW